jgi:hypothetical protein
MAVAYGTGKSQYAVRDLESQEPTVEEIAKEADALQEGLCIQC